MANESNLGCTSKTSVKHKGSVMKHGIVLCYLTQLHGLVALGVPIASDGFEG